MLQLTADHKAFVAGLVDRELDAVTLTREDSPREWLCHSAGYMILVRWQHGVLGLGVGESEYEVYDSIKICAIDYDLIKEDTLIEFKTIKEFMDWTYDDYICLGME